VIARTTGELASLEDIRSVLVARRGQGKTHLRDVAEGGMPTKEVRVLAGFNGHDGVKM
jgi:multidrug efflux pump subunit AcrB